MFKFLLSIRVIRVLMAALVLAVIQAGPAAAAPTLVGELPATGSPYISTQSHSGTFSDDFTFSLSGFADLSASLASLELDQGSLSIFNIDNLQFSLYSLVGGLPSALLASGVGALGFDSLSGGDYLIRVTGTANGLAGGQYLFGLAAAAVPEPEQWMLFATALLAMGGIARRRIR